MGPYAKRLPAEKCASLNGSEIGAASRGTAGQPVRAVHPRAQEWASIASPWHSREVSHLPHQRVLARYVRPK